MSHLAGDALIAVKVDAGRCILTYVNILVRRVCSGDVGGALCRSSSFDLRCNVRRFWAGHEKKGKLVHRPGGSWAVDYDPTTHTDDEQGFKLSHHLFAPNEYVSFKENDGVWRTFRVVTVEDVVGAF
jgi:hypothetical protein